MSLSGPSHTAVVLPAELTLPLSSAGNVDRAQLRVDSQLVQVLSRMDYPLQSGEKEGPVSGPPLAATPAMTSSIQTGFNAD
jgi:hypothetical protein